MYIYFALFFLVVLIVFVVHYTACYDEVAQLFMSGHMSFVYDLICNLSEQNCSFALNWKVLVGLDVCHFCFSSFIVYLLCPTIVYLYNYLVDTLFNLICGKWWIYLILHTDEQCWQQLRLLSDATIVLFN